MTRFRVSDGSGHGAFQAPKHVGCDGTVLIHHDLAMSCTARPCSVPSGSDEWLLAHTRFNGCDYVLRRCERCSTQVTASPWGGAVTGSAA